MTVIQQSGTVDPSVGDAAGPNHHAVAGSAAEIASSSHGAVVFPFWALELQTQPKALRKVRRTEVTQGRHLVGAGEQDLHAHVETDLTVGHRRGPGCVAGKTEAATEGAPALPLRVGMTPFRWEKNIVRICVRPSPQSNTSRRKHTLSPGDFCWCVFERRWSTTCWSCDGSYLRANDRRQVCPRRDSLNKSEWGRKISPLSG